MHGSRPTRAVRGLQEEEWRWLGAEAQRGMLPTHPPHAAALWWLSRKEATRFLPLSPFAPLEERDGLSAVLSAPG